MLLPFCRRCLCNQPNEADKSFQPENRHQQIYKELEGHSLERMYLRQRCSDAAVNKTVLKPRLAAAAGRQYVGFSRHN